MDLSEAKHAFVTGGASGIGLGIAEALAGRGIAVTVADANEQALAELVGRFHTVRLDVRDRDGWQRAKESAEAANGPVDILVNNAGIAPDGRQLADMAPDSFDMIMAINLTGVFNGVSAFGDSLRALGRGHMVNTASMAGVTAEHPGTGGYCASKFAVVGLTEILRREMEPHGVGVSVLCPGMVESNLPGSTMRLGGGVRDTSETVLRAEMKPAHVGKMVLRGIEENRLYIFTHPERLAPVQSRHAGIVAGFDGV
jgi:NAD(P)-dependent dehydrogenase (short-subunit alcohol dehydrogenase family)